jgi:large subunit ribosomal protein L10e
MGLRPARCFRKIERSFTRIAPRVQRKNFLGGVPGVRTRDFTMGNQTKDFDTQFDIVSKESMQIRDNAIESMRQKLVKKLTELVGKDGFVIKIRLYPHHVLREHKSAQGAGADRVSKGMKHAYGKNTGRAIQIRDGQLLLSVVVNKEKKDKVRIILKGIKYKVNMPFEIAEKPHLNKVLSGRKKWTREAKIEKSKELEAKAAGTTAAPAAAPAKGGKAPAGKAAPKAGAKPEAKAKEPGKKKLMR